MTWVVVVPVKGSSGAKSRLGQVPGRAALAEAFALDTVSALLAARSVAQVVVVTGNAVLGARLAELGAVIVPEALSGRSTETGHERLNAAIARGVAAARRAFPRANLAVMTGDLPALRPAEVDATTALAAAYQRAMVPDAEGVGTTTLFALADVPITPRFGGGSRASHEADGHVVLDLPPNSSLRRDVDTVADLDAARVLGLGQHTSALH